jgi:AraC-like DNA-binding protein
MQYREYAPSALLAHSVHCLWTLTGEAAAATEAEAQPVLPDGRPELIVHLADPFERLHADGRHERQPAAIFAGQLSSQLLLRPTGRTAIAGVRFRPDGAAAFLRESQHRFAGLTVPVGDISARLARTIETAREASQDPAPVVMRLQALLPALIAPAVDMRVRHVVDRIGRQLGMIGIRELASEVGLTARHLERRFEQVVGISPKRLARIARFQHALAMLDRLDGARGTRTAAACGFADQAHFVRDFHELAGCPPGEHMLQRAELTSFFSARSPSLPHAR